MQQWISKGEEMKGVYLPAMPATDFLSLLSSVKLRRTAFLERPMVKVDYGAYRGSSPLVVGY